MYIASVMEFLNYLTKREFVHSVGGDFFVKKREDGLFEIYVHPLNFGDLYYLLPDVLDCALVAVTTFEDEIFDVIKIKDEVEEKRLTQLLSQDVRLEFVVVMKEVTEDELREAFKRGYEDEIFGDFFYCYCWKNRFTLLIVKNELIIDKILPWFFRRPFFEIAEKSMKSDLFFLTKIKPLLENGIHFNEDNIFPEGDGEEGGNLPGVIYCAVGMDFIKGRLPKNWSKLHKEIEVYPYRCDEKGGLHLKKKHIFSPEEYEKKVGGIYGAYGHYGFIYHNLIFLLSLIGWFLSHGKVHSLLMVISLIIFHIDLAVTYLYYLSYSLKNKLYLENIEISHKDGVAEVELRVVNGNPKYVEGIFLDLNLLDQKGKTISKTTQFIYKIAPDGGVDLKFSIADENNLGKSVVIEGR